jgi:hypothetical protein
MEPSLLNKNGPAVLFVLTFLAVFSVGPAEGQDTAGGDNEGALVLRSYHHTFPEKTDDPFETPSGWAMNVGTAVFYWAGGRLLPPSLLAEMENWKPHDFSLYPEEAPPPERYSPADIERLRQEGSAEARLAADGRDDRYYGFITALYGGATRQEAEAQLERISFLGRNIPVHSAIAASMKRVDAALKNLAGSNPEVKTFIENAGAVDSYNWRQIRGTNRMSYHSWGLAVDIRPVDLESKSIYWLWEQEYNKNWMNVPLKNRWQPPPAVIRIFENEGFIWGGKWELYDNMHFEFRPELHELNRILAAQSNPERIIRSAETKDLHHIFPGK